MALMYRSYRLMLAADTECVLAGLLQHPESICSPHPFTHPCRSGITKTRS